MKHRSEKGLQFRIWKGHKRTFWGNGNDQYLRYDLNMCVHTDQNLANMTKCIHFNVVA